MLLNLLENKSIKLSILEKSKNERATWPIQIDLHILMFIA